MPPRTVPCVHLTAATTAIALSVDATTTAIPLLFLRLIFLFRLRAYLERSVLDEGEVSCAVEGGSRRYTTLILFFTSIGGESWRCWPVEKSLKAQLIAIS